MSKIFKLMAWFWIGSPLIYSLLWWGGIFNFHHDWAIAAVLGLVSFAVMGFIIHYGRD